MVNSAAMESPPRAPHTNPQVKHKHKCRVRCERDSPDARGLILSVTNSVDSKNRSSVGGGDENSDGDNNRSKLINVEYTFWAKHHVKYAK